MKQLEKALDVAMSAITSAVMLVLLIFGTWQIFTRWILNDPSTFTEELLRYLLIWAGMIGAAYCFFHDKHVKLTMKVLQVVDDIIVLIFVVYAYIYGGVQMVAANTEQLTAVMRIPMSLVYGCLPASGIFVVLAKILRYLSVMTESGTEKGGE